MKTPQVPHGVIDMRLDEEITTPLTLMKMKALQKAHKTIASLRH